MLTKLYAATFADDVAPKPPDIVKTWLLTVSVIDEMSAAAIFVVPSYCREPAIFTDFLFIANACVPPVNV